MRSSRAAAMAWTCRVLHEVEKTSDSVSASRYCRHGREQLGGKRKVFTFIKRRPPRGASEPRTREAASIVGLPISLANAN